MIHSQNCTWNLLEIIYFLQVEKRALEIWGSEEKLLEELENREEKKIISKQKSYQKKMKSVYQFFGFL